LNEVGPSQQRPRDDQSQNKSRPLQAQDFALEGGGSLMALALDQKL